MTQPTEQQLKDPTWWEREAPPWAKTIIRAKDNRDLWWFEHHVGRGTAMNLRSEQQITADNTGFAHAWEVVVIRPEPQSQEWDGKSWPIPVGVTVKNWRGEHRTVIVHDGSNIVCRCDDSGGYRGYSKGQATTHKLQPLRTKEQRDRDELLEIIYMNEPSEVIADAILAAGWRKGAE